MQRGEDFGLFDPVTGEPALALIQNGIWEALVKDPDYQASIKDLETSFAWDQLIDHFASDLLTGGLFDMFQRKVTDNELALVAMALQPRGYRADLADAFLGFVGTKGKSIGARLVVGDNETAFVFTAGDSGDREFRTKELGVRCLVVRARCKGVRRVVGIATDRPREGKRGHSSDIVYVDMPEWDPAMTPMVDKAQSDLGYFKNIQWPA